MADFDAYAYEYASLLGSSLGRLGDRSDYFAAHKAAYLRRLLGFGFAGPVLDFGCGVGMLTARLRQAFPASTLHAYDPSRESIERVPTEVRSGVLFTSDEKSLGNSYGLIVAAGVFHHIPPSSRLAALQDLAGRLGVGGCFVMFEHNPLNPLTRRVVERCPFDGDAVLIGRGEAIALASAARLRVSRSDYTVFFPPLLRALGSLEPFLAWCPLGAQYALVCESQQTRVHKAE